MANIRVLDKAHNSDASGLLTGLKRGTAALALSLSLLPGALSNADAGAATAKLGPRVAVSTTEAATSFTISIKTTAQLNKQGSTGPKYPCYEVVFATGNKLSSPMDVYQDKKDVSLKVTYKRAFGVKTLTANAGGVTEDRVLVYVMNGNKRGSAAVALVQPPDPVATALPAPTFTTTPTIGSSSLSYTGVQPLTQATTGTYAMGLGAFGTFSTNAVLGRTTLSSLAAQSSDGTPNANLELNSELTITTTSGTQYYWLQNVENFNTSASTVQASGWVWSQKPQAFSFSDNYGYTGTGAPGGATGTFCYHAMSSVPYSLPSTIDSLTGISAVTPSSVTVSFANSVSMGGFTAAPSENTFYQVTIAVLGASVVSAAITGNPSEMQPIDGTSYIWAGQTGGTAATFSSMSSKMAIYSSSTGVLLTPLQATQDFGYTGESSANIVVSPSGNAANITTGTQNPGEIKTGSG